MAGLPVEMRLKLAFVVSHFLNWKQSAIFLIENKTLMILGLF